MKTIDILRIELNKHLNSVGLDTEEFDVETAASFCDCVDEDFCEKKREAILKAIKILEAE